MRDAVNKWKWKSFSILILSEVAILTAVALLVTGTWPGTKLANMQLQSLACYLKYCRVVV